VGSKELPADLVRQIVWRTDGVPLFVEELTKSVLESGELRDVGDRYEYAGSAASMAIPATLRDSLTARLDRLIPVKEIAQIGAAIGREFSYKLVSAVAQMPEADLEGALDRLVESGLAFRRGTNPDAMYMFKHALVQDAAYDSLLKARRQELHAMIARVLENQFPSARDTEPELLARHYTAAGLPDHAIGYWRKAGELTLQRMALHESIAHLEKGLELVASLPPSPDRDGQELDLRTLLGTAWMALKGWAAPEVSISVQPALGLAKSLGRHQALPPVYWGLWVNVMVQGRVADSIGLAEETLAAAAATGDPDILIVGHMEAMISNFWLGELLTARAHGDKILDLYREEDHRHIVMLINHDPKTITGLYAANWTWMLGYPDQAVVISEAKDSHGRIRGHPVDLGLALTLGAHAFDYRCEPDALHARGVEAERIGVEKSLPLIQVIAQVIKGIAALRAGQIAESIAQLKASLGAWSAAGSNCWLPYVRAVMGEALARAGDLAGALNLVNESIAQTERVGWGERAWLAEILRLKGWMLGVRGEDAEAERWLREAVEFARHQQSKSWELRASTSLARLLADRGERSAAQDLLAPIYGWFSEGFTSKDLREAKELLEGLHSGASTCGSL
jgi:predicted ATPase